MSNVSMHEDLARTHEVRRSSDRSFGLIVGSAFLLAGAWPSVHGRPVVRWALATAACLLALALLRPRTLAPLHSLWFRLGLALQAVVSPVVLGVLFFLTVTPIGVVMRLVGKNPLKLGLDRGARSYWIDRRPPGPAPDTMRH